MHAQARRPTSPGGPADPNPGGDSELSATKLPADQDNVGAHEITVLEELALRLRSIEATLGEHGQQLQEIGGYLRSRAEKSDQEEPTPTEPGQPASFEAPKVIRRGLLGWLARRLV